MVSHCHGYHCSATAFDARSPRLRRVLWIALILNAAMFAVEIVGGLKSGSVSLLADAVDFAGDAANYALSLTVLSMGLLWRARAAWIKGATMGAYGAFVLGKAAWAAAAGSAPEPITMGAIAVIALAVNAGVAVMLFGFREGDANLRSVWLCSRNDAIGNLAVGIAALGVFGTGTAWPDLAVASVMATLALTASVSVLRQARGEIELATSTAR
ncbi:cation transporter [Zeimonas arvi]|nr:cation transporter [Zeimonas arvi]